MYTLLFGGEKYILNNSYGSKYLENADDEEIPVIYKPLTCCFERNLTEINDDDLKYYIIFWDYLNSEQMFIEGIFEWYCIRKYKDFEIENIKNFIKDLDDEKYGSRYNEIIKLMIRRGWLEKENKLALNGNLECLKYYYSFGNKHHHPCQDIVESGNIECLEYIFDMTNAGEICTGLYTALRLGNLEMIKYIKEKTNRNFDYHSLQTVLVSGNLESIDYVFHGQGYYTDLNFSHCEVLISENHLHVLKHFRVYITDRNILWTAVSYGKLEILKYLLEFLSWFDHYHFMDIKYPDIEVLKYAHGQGCPVNIGFLEAVISIGDLDFLKLLFEKNFKFASSDLLRRAIFCQNLEIVKFLWENGCPRNGCIANYAVYSRNIEILDYLYQNGCYFPENICEIYVGSCFNVNIEIIKYLHSKGFNLNSIVELAFQNGYFEILKFAHQYYPLPEKIRLVQQFVSIECLDYVLKNGSKLDPDDIWDGSPRNLEFLKCITKYGYNIDPKYLETCCTYINLFEEFKYAHQNGCSIYPELYYHASKHKNIECFKYIHEQGVPFPQDICDYSVIHNSFQCLRYAYECGIPITIKLSYRSCLCSEYLRANGF